MGLGLRGFGFGVDPGSLSPGISPGSVHVGFSGNAASTVTTSDRSRDAAAVVNQVL